MDPSMIETLLGSIVGVCILIGIVLLLIKDDTKSIANSLARIADALDKDDEEEVEEE